MLLVMTGCRLFHMLMVLGKKDVLYSSYTFAIHANVNLFIKLLYG